MSGVTFRATVESRSGGGVTIRLPFDADRTWGERARHHVAGTIEGNKVRGAITAEAGGHELRLGPAWCRDPRVGPGAEVTVVLAPEGPQVGSLAPDLVAAFAADPEARRAFETLATFYRKGFLRWIDGARRPENRTKRIAEMLQALKDGSKVP